MTLSDRREISLYILMALQMSFHMPSKVWGGITYSFPNFTSHNTQLTTEIMLFNVQ